MALRPTLILLLFLCWTLPLIPLQLLLVKLQHPGRKWLPLYYHRVVAWLMRVKIRVEGRPANQAPVLFIIGRVAGLYPAIAALDASLCDGAGMDAYA